MSPKTLMHLEAGLLEGDWIIAVFNLLIGVGASLEVGHGYHDLKGCIALSICFLLSLLPDP